MRDAAVVLSSELFAPYEAQYNVLFTILLNPHEWEYIDDCGSVIMGQTNRDLAMWAWHADTHEARSDAERAFLREYPAGDLFKIQADEHIAGRLIGAFQAEYGGSAQLRGRIIPYICPKIIRPPAVEGALSRPRKEDLGQIAESLISFAYDCFGTVLDEQIARENALSALENPNYYVWRAADGTIISTASSGRLTNRFCTIGQVYTFPQYRNKGYAAACVAQLCDIVAQSGSTPMLYADAANPASNKAYQNIGFLPEKPIDQWEWRKND